MLLIGDKSLLAFELGDILTGTKQSQHITIWVGGQRLNPFDDVVYLPGFYSNLSREIEKLECKRFVFHGDDTMNDDECFRSLQETGDEDTEILSYDASICAAKCFYLERGGKGVILFSHWDPRHQPSVDAGKVFSVVIDRDSVLSILRETKGQLSIVWY